MKSKYWEFGERAAFAEAAGISRQQLSDILHRRRGVSVARARKFALITLKLFGHSYLVTWIHWVENRTSEHSAFFGRPQ